MSTDALPRARSSVEVLGSPQGGRERFVACVYWIGMLFMAALLIDRWFDDDIRTGEEITVSFRRAAGLRR